MKQGRSLAGVVGILGAILTTTPSSAGKDPDYVAGLERRTAIARGCVDSKGAAQCRREIQAVREILMDRNTRSDAEAFIANRITDRPALPKGFVNSCSYPEMLSAKVQRQANREIAKIQLREDLIGVRFETTKVNLVLDEGDLAKIKFLERKGEKEACFPYLQQRINELHAEYDARARRR